ncbi:hypothetical protein [Sorangium sp. So ce1182]|uniref:hypothetical protein n=1 Tax=Sorangium sp. So ce1182 TaxID=3133334 RepID=UPI003F62E694
MATGNKVDTELESSSTGSPRDGAGAEVEAQVGELGAMAVHLVELGHIAAEDGAAAGGTPIQET